MALHTVVSAALVNPWSISPTCHTNVCLIWPAYLGTYSLAVLAIKVRGATSSYCNTCESSGWHIGRHSLIHSGRQYLRSSIISKWFCFLEASFRSVRFPPSLPQAYRVVSSFNCNHRHAAIYAQFIKASLPPSPDWLQWLALF